MEGIDRNRLESVFSPQKIRAASLAYTDRSTKEKVILYVKDKQYLMMSTNAAAQDLSRL